MKKCLLEIYSLAVCFVTVICFVIALGVGIYDILEISNPELTLKSYQYQKHQTNEAFSRNWPRKNKKPGDSELTKLREKSYTVALAAEKRDAVQSIIRILIIIFIDLAVFLIHWKLGKRARESGGT